MTISESDFFMIRTMVYHRKKIWVVFLICALLLLGLVGRLLYLMGAQSEYYSKKADDLHERERDIKAARGKILDINGNIYNEEFTNFQKELNSLPTPSEKDLEQKAEEFIMKHHSSFVSLYLLDKYFVQKDSPDFNKIKKLIEVMTGILQDKLYIEQLNEAISLSEKTETGKYAPFFSLSNIKGEKITRSSEDFKKKNLLINFWASWGDSISNHQSNTELKEIYQKYKKNKHIAMLGISLDMDKQEWQDAIKRDTLNWEQVCDFGGLNSEVAKQYAIKQVPSNILLSADGKILAKNLKGEQLKKKIEEVVTAAEEKEKQDNKKKK